MFSKKRIISMIFLALILIVLAPHTVKADDYQITGDILTGYYGPGGDIILPKNILKVGVSVFKDNASITSVTIPEGYLFIDDGAFDGCSNMTSVSLPSTLVEIGAFAFARCNRLQYCYLPNSIEVIEDGAFRECHALTTIEVPEKTEIIGPGCFCYCDSIDMFHVNQSNTHFCVQDGALFTADMTELIQYPCGNKSESYTIPEGVKTIRRNAFTHATTLKKVTIPSTVTKLMEFAFSSCISLTEITLPSSVSDVSNSAFKNASNLCRVYVHNDNIQIDPRAFIGDYSVILYGNRSSEIEKYAKKYNLRFSELGNNNNSYYPIERSWILA